MPTGRSLATQSLNIVMVMIISQSLNKKQTTSSIVKHAKLFFIREGTKVVLSDHTSIKQSIACSIVVKLKNELRSRTLYNSNMWRSRKENEYFSKRLTSKFRYSIYLNFDVKRFDNSLFPIERRLLYCYFNVNFFVNIFLVLINVRFIFANGQICKK